MQKRAHFVIFGMVILAIAGAIVAYTAMSKASARAASFIQDPETAERHGVGVMPLLVSPDFEAYTRLPPGSIDISAPAGVPLAHIPDLSADLREAVSVKFPGSGDWWESDEVVGFAVLSSVRYAGSGHVVVVSISKPTPAALREQFVAGDRTVTLADGSRGWLTTGRPDGLTNAVAFLKNDLIITVASDLSPERVVELASKVVIETTN